MINKKLLFVTGLQKSGTSLLNRLLLKQSSVANPYMPEGKHLWGDDPPFSPEKPPCGRVYQKYQGKNGHEITPSDFDLADQELLIHRINKSEVVEPLVMNKNPYLILRLQWLKKMFPTCKVVVVVRNPVSNIYSLSKKYCSGEYWWGLKPKGWEGLLKEDKVLQTALQWRAVYKRLLEDISFVDLFIDYPSLCQSPNKQIKKILNLYNLSPDYILNDKLTCMDNEYLTGGQIESRNVGLRKTGKFSIMSSDNDFPPFTQDQISTINDITGNVWSDFISFREKEFI